MEGTERAQPVHFCLNKIVYQSCWVLWTWMGLNCLNRIVYQSCRVLWTWKGLSEPSVLSFVLIRIV